MRKFLRSTLIASLGLVAPMLASTLPALAQQTIAMPQIQHVALSVELAKQAIDATLFIRKNYNNRRFTDADPADMVSAMRNKGVYNKMATQLRQFGFSSPEAWSQAAVSTAIAVGFMKNNGGQDMMAQMMQMQNDNGMSEQMKAQMLATVKAISPPKANMKVAKLILADRTYAKKVERLFEN